MVAEDCSIGFDRLTESGVDMDQPSDHMLKVVNAVTRLYEKVIDDL